MIPGRLTLREVARPAMVAYELLATQQRQAKPLVEEAQALLATADQLLRELGVAQVLAAPAGGAVEGDQATRLASAYSAAGLAWARLIAHVGTLAELHAARAEWARAHHLVQVIAAAGELEASTRATQVVEERLHTLIREVCVFRSDALPITAGELREGLGNILLLLEKLDGATFQMSPRSAESVAGQVGIAADAGARLLRAKYGESLPRERQNQAGLTPVEQSHNLLFQWIHHPHDWSRAFDFSILNKYAKSHFSHITNAIDSHLTTPKGSGRA